MGIVNIKQKLQLFSEQWSPKRIGTLNGQQVLVAKLQGEFVWHSHENEDEFFLVIKGQLIIELKNEQIVLNEGEFYIVPKGVEHKPIAKNEVHVLLFEPLSIKHTGEVMTDLTVTNYESI